MGEVIESIVRGGDRGLISRVYAPISLWKIFHEDTWRTEFNDGKFFEGKTVLIGPAEARFQDFHATPSGTIPGAQLHLQALGCLLAGGFFVEAPPHWHWVSLIAMALLGSLLGIWFRNPLWVLLVAIVVVVAWLAGTVLVANEGSILMGGISGVLGLTLAVLFGLLGRIVRFSDGKLTFVIWPRPDQSERERRDRHFSG